VELAAGFGHQRSAIADAFDTGMLPLQFANEVRAVHIATRFTGREKDAHDKVPGWEDE
jgi:hypothetical protein